MTATPQREAAEGETTPSDDLIDVAETVHRFIGCMNRHQASEASDLFTENGVFEGGPRFNQPYVGRDRIAKMLTTYFDFLKELMVQTTGIFYDRNEAVVVIEIYATVSGKALPDSGASIGPHGERKVSWRGVYQFTFDPEGRITHLRVFGDRSTTRWFANEDDIPR